MLTRDSVYYGIINDGLSSIGYRGQGAFNAWVNDSFSRKYNSEKTFAKMGFPLDPNLPIAPTFEQLDVTVRPYTMAGYVDIDSDGPTKSTDGFTLKQGKMPTFKHEVTMTRKTMREQMLLRNRLGASDSTINSIVVKEMYNGVDKLLGGNYNTIEYQRHQIVSTFKLIINKNNNPAGIPLEIDFNVDKSHTVTGKHAYTRTGGAEAVEVEEGANNILTVMYDVRRNAKRKDFCPTGHWEMSDTTFETLINLNAIRKMYATAMYPNATADFIEVTARFAKSADIKAFIEEKIGAPIIVQDKIASVEKFNKATGKIEYTDIESFEEGWATYLPDGAIGSGQFAAPFFIETPGAVTSTFDGGRTLIRQLFEDKTMSYAVSSEVTGLLVPDKTRWMYRIQVGKIS